VEPLEYHEISAMDRADIEAALTSGSENAIIDALLSAAYQDRDLRWVQTKCLEHLDHDNREIRRIAVLCLGHLARIHRQLDLEKVLPKLNSLKSDPELGGSVEDALDDIRTFIPVH
jgi:hypothetical protein